MTESITHRARELISTVPLLRELDVGRSQAFSRLVRSGDAARDRRDWKGAVREYRAAVAIRPDRAAIWVQLGNCAKEARDFWLARSAYEKASQLKPGVADTHLQLGHLLKVMGDTAGAREHYRRAHAIDPMNPDVAIEMRAMDGASPSEATGPAEAKPRRKAGPPRALPLKARLVQARGEIEDLIRLSKGPDGGSDVARGALRDAQPALGEALEALDGILAKATGIEVVRSSGDDEADAIEVVFDVSDLIQYFRHHRLPTGIQRVQIEVISIAVLQSVAARRVRICCFTETDDYWREVPHASFLQLCELSLIDNDWTAPDWREAMDDLEERLSSSPDFAFGQGAFLINIGTSWWLQNYFLHVREAKRRSQIRYVPFVHDMIPIITPEFCVDGLVQDFISWAQGVYFHADYFLVNSESTRRDLKRVGAALGQPVDDALVRKVTLDADYRKPGLVTGKGRRSLATHRLVPGGFVLFVSTIEARKNHLAVFDAWLQLCKEMGADAVPRLVCVGSRGWLNDAIFGKLAASQTLRDKVLMLSGVPDDELALLYEQCLFSVYPSFYEGWGLPVTESLSYGKTAVVARSSSLTEAGGPYVDYFTLGDNDELVSRLRRLIVEPAYRQAREQMIRLEHRPRGWKDVAGEMIGAVEAWRGGRDHVPVAPRALDLGRYYAFARNAEIGIYHGMQTAEFVRTGDRWWGPNEWGCWLKPGPAQMEITVPAPGRYRFYLGLRSVPATDTAFDLSVLGGAKKRGVVSAERPKWIAVTLEAEASDAAFDIVLEGYGAAQVRPRDDLDAVPVSIGVIGIMLCSHDDEAARGRFAEALAIDGLDELARGDEAVVTFLPQAEDEPSVSELDALAQIRSALIA